MAQPSDVSTKDYIVTTKTFTTEDGISHRRVRSFSQDVYGFMWMGTPYGLNRYDGYEFKTYNTENANLFNNNVAKVLTAPDSLLWLIYSRDLDRWNAIDIFDPIKGVAQPFKTYFKEQQVFEVDAVDFSSFQENQDKSLWFATYKTLYEYDGKNIKQVLKVADSLELVNYIKIPANSPKTDVLGWAMVYTPSKHCQFLAFNKAGKIIDQTPLYSTIKDWFGSALIRVQDDGTVLYFVNAKNNQGKTEATTYKKHLYKPASVFEYSTKEGYRHQRYVIAKNELWCANTNQELIIFDEQGKLLYKAAMGPQFAIFPEASYLDKKGNFWLSFKSRISVTSIKSNPFQLYIHNNPQVGQLGCRGIVQDSAGRIYVNGHRGSFYIDETTQKIHSLPKTERFYHNVNLDTALRVALLLDEDQTVWLTDQFHRLLHYYPKQNKIESFTTAQLKRAIQSKKSTISMNWALYKDRRGQIWIGQNAGLSYLDSDDKVLKKYTDYGDFKQLGSSEVFYFYENEAGVWLATSSGLYLATHEMKIIAHFHPNADDPQYYLPHTVIAHLYEDQDGVFWIATKGGGLIQWNPKTKDYKQWTRTNGLAHNIVYAVYGDDNGYLWLSSDMGLMRMNKKEETFQNYLPRDGVSHEEFNTTSHYKAADGTLFFGSLNGVTAIKPKNFIEKNAASTTGQVYISSWIKHQYKNGKDIKYNYTRGAINNNKIAIHAFDRSAVLKFSALDYVKPESVIYAYKIHNLDNKWHYVNDPILHLVGLPYGPYKLEIKTQGSNAAPLELKMLVHPPIYLQHWFLVTSFLLLVLLIYLFVQWRERKLRRQKIALEAQIAVRTEKIQQQAEDLKALDQIKSRFFANISHELRTPLTLILGPLSVLLKKEKNKTDRFQLETIERNGQHLLRLVEDILDLSKMDANKLDVIETEVVLQPWIRRVFSAYESQALIQKLTYNFTFQNLGVEDIVVRLDQDKTEKILNNFLSNSLKFTPEGGTLTLHVTKEEKHLVFSVEDTGRGISKKDLAHIFERFYQASNQAEGGTGIGLAFSKELAALMGGHLTVESIVGKGSTFSFYLPLKLVDSLPTTHVETFLEEEPLPITEPFIGIDAVKVTSNKQATIMLVEDNLDMQAYIQGLLSPIYQLIPCHNGQIALDYLNEHRDNLPDLIISDVMMPQMDGFTFLEHCKKEELFRKIPIVMLTARSAIEDKLNALTIGVDDYLTKPFVVDELLIRIQNLLQHAQMRHLAAKEAAVEQEATSNTKEKATLGENDQLWVKEVEKIALEEVDDPDFDAEALAQKVNMSRRNLQRRLKKTIGLTPGQYIKEVRLQTARSLLERGVYQTIAEVAYASGFSTPYYFSQVYEKRFGKKVSAYLG